MNTLSNTSPLYYLHQLNLIELLPSLFGEVVVPEAVVQELDRGRQGQHSVPTLSELAWLRVESVQPHPELEQFGELGPGEREVLSLALRVSSPLVLLDDLDARKVAARYSIPQVGTVGILLRAKQLGRIAQLGPLLDGLRAAGFYMAEPLYRRLLRDAGEGA